MYTRGTGGSPASTGVYYGWLLHSCIGICRLVTEPSIRCFVCMRYFSVQPLRLSVITRCSSLLLVHVLAQHIMRTVLGVLYVTSQAANLQSLKAAWFTTVPCGTRSRPPSRVCGSYIHLAAAHPRSQTDSQCIPLPGLICNQTVYKSVPFKSTIHSSSGRRFHFLTSVLWEALLNRPLKGGGPPFPRMMGSTTPGEAGNTSKPPGLNPPEIIRQSRVIELQVLTAMMRAVMPQSRGSSLPSEAWGAPNGMNP